MLRSPLFRELDDGVRRRHGNALDDGAVATAEDGGWQDARDRGHGAGRRPVLVGVEGGLQQDDEQENDGEGEVGDGGIGVTERAPGNEAQDRGDEGASQSRSGNTTRSCEAS